MIALLWSICKVGSACGARPLPCGWAGLAFVPLVSGHAEWDGIAVCWLVLFDAASAQSEVTLPTIRVAQPPLVYVVRGRGVRGLAG